jgi:hypothetical protein
MKELDRLLSLSGQFEPFVPSVHLCSITESLSVMAGLDSLTRLSAAASAQPQPPPAAVAPVQVVPPAPARAAPAPSAVAKAPAPPSPSVRFTSSRKDYLPALQDPALVQALLSRASRPTTTSSPSRPARQATPSNPQNVAAQPKPRPFLSSQRSHTMPILSSHPSSKESEK